VPALPASIASRLAHQLDSLELVVDGIPSATLKARPPSGKWSAHENLAHLVQHHRATMTRIRRILVEHRPQLPSYKADDDPEWPKVNAAETADILKQLKSCRAELRELVEGLSSEQLARTGFHPAFGEMNIEQWLQFFLLHEAHHLYVAFSRARGRD
jgi:uncharacterized damage-inducible protein DinB